MKILAFVDTHGSDKAINKIREKAKKENADILICAGDVSVFEQNLEKILKKLDSLNKPVLIIPGNHDGGLRQIIGQTNKKIKLHPNTGAVLYGTGVFHGHAWPTEKVLKTSRVLLAHNHPHILFVDKLGGRASYPCWIRGKLF